MPRSAARPPRRIRWPSLLLQLALFALFACLLLPAVVVGTAGRLVVESTAYAPSTYAGLRHVAAEPLPLPFDARDSAVDEAAAARLYRLTLGLRSGDTPGVTLRTGDQLPVPALDSVPSGLFVESRSRFAARPDRAAVLAALERGLTRVERDFVAGVAASPVWRAWDSLATASRLDVVDAVFELPLAPSVAPMFLPDGNAARVRALLDGTAFRAVHLASIGQREAAIQAIGSTASVGRLLSSESPLVIDALIGLQLMRASAEMLAALERAQPVAGSAERAATLDSALATLARQREATAGGPSTGRELADAALQTVRDPAAPRAEWMDALSVLAFAPCNHPWSAFVGGGAARAEAFAYAQERRRYASDSLLIHQWRELLRHPPREVESTGMQRLLRVLARGGSFITRNPTMESCILYLDVVL